MKDSLRHRPSITLKEKKVSLYLSHFLVVILLKYLSVIKELIILKRGSDGKASVCNAGDPGSIPGLGRSLGEQNGSPFQYSCLEKPMDGRAW